MRNYRVVLLLVIFTMIFSAPAAKADTRLKHNICKAAIAVTMGRSPDLMETKGIGNGLVYLYYVRDDGTYWEYHCKLEGSAVIWRKPGGRWRWESPVNYRVNKDGSITVWDVQMGNRSKTYSFK